MTVLLSSRNRRSLRRRLSPDLATLPRYAPKQVVAAEHRHPSQSGPLRQDPAQQGSDHRPEGECKLTKHLEAVLQGMRSIQLAPREAYVNPVTTNPAFDVRSLRRDSSTVARDVNKVLRVNGEQVKDRKR